MRPLIVLLVAICVVGYSVHRNQQARAAREVRAAFVRDSIHRADSLAYAAIQAKMGAQAAAQLQAQQGMATMAQAQNGAAAARAASR